MNIENADIDIVPEIPNNSLVDVRTPSDIEEISEHCKLNNIPDDIIFPDELNKFLRQQIGYHTYENGMLKKNLYDLEVEYNKGKTKILELENKLSQYENLNKSRDFLTSNQVASMKIVELSKKLREQTSELESFKTKYSRLEKHLFYLENEIADKNNGNNEEKTELKSNNGEDELKKLQEKLNGVTNKLSETRNINLQLKNEIKLANKWLQQEIGESFESLQSLNSNGNWRGRAQIIFDLQQKNNDLREKLKIAQGKTSGILMESPSQKLESKNSDLSKEVDDLKVKCEELKKKNDALRARCKVLDSEVSLQKSKFSMQKEQSQKDHEIITALTAQISTCQSKAVNEDIQQKERLLRKIQTEKLQLQKQLEEYKILVTNMKEDLCKRGENSAKERYKSDNNINTNEEKQRLLNLLEVQNKRLSAERDAHAKTVSLLKIEKQKVAKAEAVVLAETNRTGYSSLSNLRALDSNLRDQLELAEENLKTLQTRLEIETYERRKDLQEFSQILENYQTKN